MNEPVRPVPSVGPLRDLLSKLGIRWPWKIRPEPEKVRDLDAERLKVQVGVIRRAFKRARLDVAGAPIEGVRRPEDDADVHYLYRPRYALVREVDVVALREYFGGQGERFKTEMGDPERVMDGLVAVAFPQRGDEEDDVLATLEELEEAGIVERGQVTPDHVVYVTIKGQLCPATEPEMPRSRRPWPPQASYDKEIPEDKKVRVTVVDTGLWKDAVGSTETPWLETDDVFAGNEDLEHVSASAIHEYAGHGTFVAGVIGCVAPETRIDVEGALPYGGAVYESMICEQIQDALTENRPQLVSISAGTHTRGGHPMLSFVMLAQNNKLDESDDVLIVAAAGNDESNEPFWPAAFAKQYPWVVSVGSVDPDRKVSDFSNYGDWVSVYARGRDLVNAFPKGTYKCYEPPNVNKIRKFDGLAQWSGTSFSTPIVTGLIAAEMRDNGGSARAAWGVVKAGATTVHDARIGADIDIVGPLT